MLDKDHHPGSVVWFLRIRVVWPFVTARLSALWITHRTVRIELCFNTVGVNHDKGRSGGGDFCNVELSLGGHFRRSDR